MIFDDYDYALAIWCAPRRSRHALAIVFALDGRLARIMPSVREALLGQIKLAWWREQLVALDNGTAPAEPLLHQVQTILTPELSGALLSGLTDDGERWATLERASELICGGITRPIHLLQSLAKQDVARTAAGRALASPAARTLRAVRLRLIGR